MSYDPGWSITEFSEEGEGKDGWEMGGRKKKMKKLREMPQSIFSIHLGPKNSLVVNKVT